MIRVASASSMQYAPSPHTHTHARAHEHALPQSSVRAELSGSMESMSTAGEEWHAAQARAQAHGQRAPAYTLPFTFNFNSDAPPPALVPLGPAQDIPIPASSASGSTSTPTSATSSSFARVSYTAVTPSPPTSRSLTYSQAFSSSPLSASGFGSGSGSGSASDPRSAASISPSVQFAFASSSSPASGGASADADGDAPTSAELRITIACSTCRRRKTKCDGARPVCANCSRRGEVCAYELAPRRRGPDRKPGTRVRSVFSKRLVVERGGVVPVGEGRRKRKREEGWEGVGVGMGAARREVRDAEAQAGEKDEDRDGKKVKMEFETLLSPADAEPSSSSDTYAGPSSSAAPPSSISPVRASFAIPYHPDAPGPGQAYITELVEDERATDARERGTGMDTVEIARPPSVDFARRTWWDALLDLYGMGREASAKQIQTDIAYVYSFSPYFISFFHVPLFWSTFHSPRTRDTLQPSLVLSFLALATFMRSSSLGAGLPGRERALQVAEIARAYFQCSVDAGWIDGGLAQAAFVLTLFEMCPHPAYSAQRLASSFWTLDGLLATLSWTSMDAYDEDAAVFAPGLVPSMSQQRTQPPSIASGPVGGGDDSPGLACNCTRLSLPSSSASALRITPLWAATPAWDPDWTESEIRKEEARRLVWNSLNLMSGHTSATLAAGEGAADYCCTRAENYALLFPGETLGRSGRYREAVRGAGLPRDSVWAVYARLALLYGACWRYFSPEGARAPASRPPSRAFPQSRTLSPAATSGGERTEGDRAAFAYRAWVETLELEEVLDRHGCAGERSTLFQGREFLFKIRVLVSRDYTKHFPFPETGIDLSFHKLKAEQWLHHQMSLAQRLMQGMNAVTGMGANDLRLRPFLLWYFALQSQRCIGFHRMDPTLTVALDVADAWMMPVDYLVQIWPCANMDTFFDTLRRQILDARLAAGMPPFLPRAKPLEVVNPMLSAPVA